MNKRQLPLNCVLLGFALVRVATRFYPRGTLDDPTVVAFDWSRHYLTNLFRRVALNGQKNAAKSYAVAGVWLYCVGVADCSDKWRREWRQPGMANGYRSSASARPYIPR